MITADKIKDAIKTQKNKEITDPEEINTEVESSLNSENAFENQKTEAKERGGEKEIKSEIDRREINEQGKKEIEEAKKPERTFKSYRNNSTPEKRVEKAKDAIKTKQDARKKKKTN